MIYLQAPWDLVQATIMLPNPQLGNLFNNDIDVNIRNSMSGEIYSYIKTNDQVKISWDLLLTREKSLELETFIEYYCSYEWRIIDHFDRSYRMFLMNEPFDVNRIKRGELTSVKLELEGREL